MGNNLYFTDIKKGIKSLASILIIAVCFSCSTQSNVYKIDKIKRLDDKSVCVYISNNHEKAIVIETNKILNTSNLSRVKLGNNYALNLVEINTNFRGKNDHYVVISETGKQYIVWDEKSGFPLKLYKAINLNGLFIKPPAGASVSLVIYIMYRKKETR
jgi:hypothetical protein